MKQRNFAAYLIGMVAAVMVMVLVSCTNQDHEDSIAVATKKATPSVNGRYAANPSFNISCVKKLQSFAHKIDVGLDIFVDGSKEPEKSFKQSILSDCILSIEPDTIRRDNMDMEDAKEMLRSQAKSYKDNTQYDTVNIHMTDSRMLKITYKAEHEFVNWMGVSYELPHDSLLAERVLPVKNTEIAVSAMPHGLSKYIKAAYRTTYPVEVKTAGAYNGDIITDEHVDTLYAEGITIVYDNNNVTYKKGDSGTKVIDDKTQQDSVVIILTWTDGHKESQVFKNIRLRDIQNIDRRQIIVNAFDNENAGSSFSRVEGSEEPARSDANWKNFGRKDTATKMISVNGYSADVRYMLYSERSEFTYNGISHSFPYIAWNLNNKSDNFIPALISDMNGHDEMDYTNKVSANYLGWNHNVDEVVSWYKKSVELVKYDTLNVMRVNTLSYSDVSLDKIAIYSDGSKKKVGTFYARIPVVVNPYTNWVINTDLLGTYVSGSFSGVQTSKTAGTTEKFFFYNMYKNRYTNNVSGQVNGLDITFPNSIVFDDGDLRVEFKDANLNVVKKNDNVAKASEDDEKTSYKYTCTAGVTFGESSQDVTMPGTINVLDNSNHEHGKVKSVYFTTTPDENRSFYKSVCVIEFEDGYRKVGLSDNGANAFDFSMSSHKNVNSAVYSGSWIPAIAEDNASARCMIWKDENGTPKRTLDFITATRNGWNNGHNTVTDVRRSAEISKSGYSVTLYLNGSAGQTLKF